jgi:CCR4-NOT transcription complex subunit 1
LYWLTISQLVESNGMDVFAKYFRRLLVGNSPQIFPGVNRNVENPGNYQLLVQEMEKITQDPEQAPRIAEIIDTSEGDIFRDFELATFMDHFKLNALAKTLLASAFTHVSKQDLKIKGRLHYIVLCFIH